MNTMTDKDQLQTQGAGVVGVSHVRESAHLHVTGAATYIDDITELAELCTWPSVCRRSRMARFANSHSTSFAPCLA